MDKPAEPSTLTMLLFGAGSLGTGIYLTVPSVLLLYYLTDVLGISAALAGLAVGPLIVGAAIFLAGFAEGAAPSTQSAQALIGVRVSLALAPAALVAASLPVLGWRRSG